LDIGHGRRENGAAIGFFAHIAQEVLHDLALDPPALDFGQVDFVAPFELANKAHVVSIMITTQKKSNTFLKKSKSENLPAKSAQSNAAARLANCSEHFWPGIQVFRGAADVAGLSHRHEVTQLSQFHAGQHNSKAVSGQSLSIGGPPAT
jgi:hypothetical protein